jgi:hypothetical protein
MDPNFTRILLTSLYMLGIIVIGGFLVFRTNPTRQMKNTNSAAEPASSLFAEVDIPRLDTDSEELYRTQLVQDTSNLEFTPDLTTDTETWPNGTVALGPSIYYGEESAIYMTQDNTRLLIKYQTDCDELATRSLHPLLRDFWYGRSAARAGVSPEPMFLSPPTLMRRDLFKVRGMKSTATEKDRCIERRGSVRFMVMERRSHAMNLYRFGQRFIGNALPFSIAMQAGITLIEKLRDLHQVARVVHGDIHAGNIMVEVSGERVDRMWIIDYGRARANIPARSKTPVNSRGHWTHAVLSHWQILGYEWSARDDVFNALRTIAWVMHDESYNTFERRLSFPRGTDRLIEWRQSGFIFTIPSEEEDLIDRLPLISISQKTAIRDSLQRILDSVRSLTDVDDIPDYDLIIAELINCFRLAPRFE